jgi:hypothetical protein
MKEPCHQRPTRLKIKSPCLVIDFQRLRGEIKGFTSVQAVMRIEQDLSEVSRRLGRDIAMTAPEKIEGNAT